MDAYNVKPLVLPDTILDIISSNKRIVDFSQKEFEDFLALPLWEDFIENSMHSISKQKLKWDFLGSEFLPKYLQNDLIRIFQELMEKIDNSDFIDYKANDNIAIKWDFLIKFKERIYNVILANNFSHIRKEIHKTVKQIHLWDEKYSESLSYAILWFAKSLKKFDTSLNFDIKTYSVLYIKSELKSVFELERAIKYPKKLLKLRKVLNEIRENESEYSDFSYYDLLIELTKNIKNLNGKIIGKVWVLYLYILWITDNTSQKEDSDEDEDETDEDGNFDIFADKIAELCANSKNINKKILKLSSELNAFDEWLDSIDRPLWEDEDSETMRDNLTDGFDITAFDVHMWLSDLNMIRDREIKLTDEYKWKSKLNLTLFERIVAGSFLEEYLTIKEYRNLLLEYGMSTWEKDRYVKRFHLYLMLFCFKNKRALYESGFSQVEDEWFDALNYEQLWNIFWFSKQRAITLYNEVEAEFHRVYWEKSYTKFDTKELWLTKTFDWMMRLDDAGLTEHDLHWVKKEYEDYLVTEKKMPRKLKK